MSKAILQFDLTDSDDKADFLRATKATSAYLVIWEMFQELRKDWKYSQDPVLAAHAEKYRDILNGLCSGNSIDLDNELN